MPNGLILHAYAIDAATVQFDVVVMVSRSTKCTSQTSRTCRARPTGSCLALNLRHSKRHRPCSRWIRKSNPGSYGTYCSSMRVTAPPTVVIHTPGCESRSSRSTSQDA